MTPAAASEPEEGDPEEKSSCEGPVTVWVGEVWPFDGQPIPGRGVWITAESELAAQHWDPTIWRRLR